MTDTTNGGARRHSETVATIEKDLQAWRWASTSGSVYRKEMDELMTRASGLLFELVVSDLPKKALFLANGRSKIPLWSVIGYVPGTALGDSELAPRAHLPINNAYSLGLEGGYQPLGETPQTSELYIGPDKSSVVRLDDVARALADGAQIQLRNQ